MEKGKGKETGTDEQWIGRTTERAEREREPRKEEEGKRERNGEMEKEEEGKG